MEESPSKRPELEQGSDEDVQTTEPARAILFNDEFHTFDEVIHQLIKALKCDRAKAEALTWEVHNQGKSCVYVGEITKCLEITHVLEEIHLMTQIEL